MTTINIITTLVTDNCCICLEDKDINYKCITCSQAKLCRKCYIKMRNHDRYVNCPTCREKNWVVEIPPIFYENHTEKINTLTLCDKINNCCIIYDIPEKCNLYCKNLLKSIFLLLLITVIIYIYGIVLFSFYYLYIENDTNKEMNDDTYNDVNDKKIVRYWDFKSLDIKYLYIGCLGGLATIFVIIIPLNFCYKNIHSIYISKTTAPVLPYDSTNNSEKETEQ